MKNVTCGYFSVSAIRNCARPALDNTSPRTFVIGIGGNATSASTLGLYKVIVTNLTFVARVPRSKFVHSLSVNAFDNWIARSGRKLKKMIASLSSTFATGLPSLTITDGITNSSVTSLA